MAAAKRPDEFHERVFFVNALLPALLIGLDWWNDRLGANPVEFVTRATGVMTLVMLTVTLAVTPLSRIFGWHWLARQRRQFGLFSFFYGSLHLLTYAFFDRGGDFATVPADVVKRPFIAIGMFCFILMIPLAVTSTNKMIQRLGIKKWKKLHRLTYVIAFGGVIHFWMIVKSDITYPLAFALVISLLLGYRAAKAAPARLT